MVIVNVLLAFCFGLAPIQTLEVQCAQDYRTYCKVTSSSPSKSDLICYTDFGEINHSQTLENCYNKISLRIFLSMVSIFWK